MELLVVLAGTLTLQAATVDNQYHEEVHAGSTNNVLHDLSWAIERVNAGDSQSISFAINTNPYIISGFVPDLTNDVTIYGETNIFFSDGVMQCYKGNVKLYDIRGNGSFNVHDGSAEIARADFDGTISARDDVNAENSRIWSVGAGRDVYLLTSRVCNVVCDDVSLEEVELGGLTATGTTTYLNNVLFTNESVHVELINPRLINVRFAGSVEPGSLPTATVVIRDSENVLENLNWTNVNLELISDQAELVSNTLFRVTGLHEDGKGKDYSFSECTIIDSLRMVGGSGHTLEDCTIEGQAYFSGCSNVLVGGSGKGNFFAAGALNDDGWLVMTNCTGSSVANNQFGKNKAGQTMATYGMTLRNCNGLTVSANGWHTNQVLDETYNYSFCAENCSNLTVRGNSMSNCPGMAFFNTCDSLVGGEDTTDRNVMIGCANGLVLRDGTHNVTVQNNYLGVDGTGSEVGNQVGIYVANAYDVVIGGTNTAHFERAASPGVHNVISGNDVAGVYITGSTNIQVQGNMIGADADGTGTWGNGGHGVWLDVGAVACVIGGSTQCLGNVISGNGSNGVFISDYASSNRVCNNSIGADITGKNASPNLMHGIAFASSSSHAVSNMIGGEFLADGIMTSVPESAKPEFVNVISGNASNGIVLGGNGTMVYGNYIGVDITGKARLANQENGIYMLNNAASCLVGNVSRSDSGAGDTYASRNLIGGNDCNGILVQGNGNQVIHNVVGLSWDGTVVENWHNGIEIGYGVENRVAGHVIANNWQNGIFVSEWSGANNVIGGVDIGNVYDNYIYANQGMGVLISNGSAVVKGNQIGVKDNDIGNGEIAPNEGMYGISILNLNDGDSVVIGSSTDSGSTADAPNAIFVSSAQDDESIHVENCRASTLMIDYNECNFYGGSLYNFSTSRYCVAVYDSANVMVGVNAGCYMVNSKESAFYAKNSTNVMVFKSVIGVTNESHYTTKGMKNEGHGMLFENCGGVQIGDVGMGNYIAGNAGDGIRFMQTGAMNMGIPSGLIIGNYIGCNTITNGRNGIYASNVWNLAIGGMEAGPYSMRNTIGGNGGCGIQVENSDTLQLLGNRIGLDSSGSGFGNGADGVALKQVTRVELGSTNGALAQSSNEIGSNLGAGARIENAEDVTVVGAYIGTLEASVVARPNQHGLILDDVASLLVYSNVISGNLGDGIICSNIQESIRISANQLGTASQGSHPLGNAGDGLRLVNVQHAYIGSQNIMAANGGNGIHLEGMLTSDNSVYGNVLGSSGLGNGINGVLITGGLDNRIGGTNEWQANEISHNAGYGVYVAAGCHNALLGNSICANLEQAIRLGTQELSYAECEDGPNRCQRQPAITNAFRGSTHVQGQFTSQANASYLLECYASPDISAGGLGEGQDFLFRTNLLTDAEGHADYYWVYAYTTPTGWWITATATDTNGNTSTFSPPVKVTVAPDTHGYGVPDYWQDDHTNLTYNGSGDAHIQDYDEDGMSDYEEYIADTDPEEADSFFAVEMGSIEIPDSSKGRLYTVERSTDLLSASWTPWGQQIGTDGPLVFDFTPTNQTEIYRVKASIP